MSNLLQSPEKNVLKQILTKASFLLFFTLPLLHENGVFFVFYIESKM
jgi:hypothetical protein